MKLTPSLDTITVEPTKKSLFDFVQMLGKMWRNLAQAFNGQISFGDGTNVDNINGSWINTTTPVAPNTDFTVGHNLNRLPVGYLVMKKDRAVDVYTGSVVATNTQITLKASVASAVIRLFVFLVLLSLAPLGFAQNTNVSGTITDAGGQTWNNGTITFIFNPGSASPPFANSGSPFTPAPIATILNASGSFSAIPIPSNSTITPTGTSWNVQVCPQATSPCSLITGVFIFGASQDISANVIPPAISVSPTPGATAYTDAQVKATKVGTHYYNLTTATDRVCATTVSDVCTVWAGAGGGGTNGSITNPPAAGIINPASAPYNAKFDAGTANTCTTTNANNIVTCSGAKFQTGAVGTNTPPAKVGHIFFANDATAGGGGVDTCLDNPDITFGGLRQTTISSVDSDTQIHVVGNSNTTSTAHACVAWGTDDTTALNAAWTAGGCIGSMLMPVGKSMFSAPIFQAIAGCPLVVNSGTGYQGQHLWGSGVTNTYLIPVPLLNFTSVAGGGGVTCRPNCTAVVGNKNISDYEQFNVWGVGQRCSATQASTTLWLVGSATRAINTNGIGWCGRGGGATLIGYNVQGDTDIYTYGGSNFFGSIEMNFDAVSVYFGNSFVSGNGSTLVGTAGIVVQSSSSVTSIANAMSTAIQVGVTGGTNSVWNSMNTSQNSVTNEPSCFYVGGGATVNLLSNDIICATPPVNANTFNFFTTSGGGIVNAWNSTFAANGTGVQVSFGGSTGTFRNNTGNVFGGGAGVFSGTGSFIQGPIAGVAFASLGTPANGSFLYCSDCTIANPCAGAGTGALAKRLAGVWVCN